MSNLLSWYIQSSSEIPDEFLQAVQVASHGVGDRMVAQLLWQRGIRDPAMVPGFLDAQAYTPASPFVFGDEMHRAVERILQAREQGERVAIWGDFDADGITATAVLWEGLGEFLPPSDLTYVIPNRLTDSHGLAIAGLDRLSADGYRLVITCDTGCGNPSEIDYAQSLGLDLIITDHHTLPASRPSVVALINPRCFPPDHPCASLSGVAVAYKLIEALYAIRPDVPTRPLEFLLDLVAIGLIADLVELKGESRYLAQRGIEQLQRQSQPHLASRPGITRLLELCKRSGDRPTDISFGLGPRINAISRIHGNADFCVELLTSRDRNRCQQLATETELANARRKALQRDITQDVTARLAQMDLSTTQVIVLADPQWSVGILGLVAAQIAQAYDRPTILLTPDPMGQNPTGSPLARGSARSVHQVDLYDLLSQQAHLLHRMGGHPFAAGLSLPVENIPLLTDAINRQFRIQYATAISQPCLTADLLVTVAELGQGLFRQLKLLEPCGMGNPPPKLLLRSVWFDSVRNRNLRDLRGGTLRYIKTEFELWDESVGQGFPGVWWEHYRDDIPNGRCEVMGELDFNAFSKRYEFRVLALRPSDDRDPIPTVSRVDWMIDARQDPASLDPAPSQITVSRCPRSWMEMQAWFRRAWVERCFLAIAYPAPTLEEPLTVWQRWVGLAKYLSRTGKIATRSQLLEKLDVGDRTLRVGIQSLQQLGFRITASDEGIAIAYPAPEFLPDDHILLAMEPFLAALREDQFQQHYFYTVPLETLQAVAHQTVLTVSG